MLRLSKSTQFTPNHASEFLYPLRRTVRQPTLALCPNMLSGIEFRRIFGKPLNMKPAFFCQNILDRPALMDQGLIPDKNHLPAEMMKQKSQKAGHIPALDIPGLEREVKPPVSAPGRNRKRRNDREPLPAVDMTDQRRPAPRRPCPPEKRDEHKTTFIQKDQMGAKGERFFLSPATVSFSSARSPLRPFLEPFAPASDNSIPIAEAPSRYGWDDNESRRNAGLPRPRAAWSRGLWNNPKPEGLPAEGRPAGVSAKETAWADDQGLVFDSSRSLLSGERPVAIGPRNLWKSQCVLPPPRKSCPERATGWPGGDAFPVAQGFLRVSYP